MLLIVSVASAAVLVIAALACLRAVAEHISERI